MATIRINGTERMVGVDDGVLCSGFSVTSSA
jgi:hypothetical protein